MDWESTQKLLLLLNAQNKRYLLTHTIAELKKLTNCPIVLKWLDEITRIDTMRDHVLPYIIDPDTDMDSIIDDTIIFTYGEDNELRVTHHTGHDGLNTRSMLIFAWKIPPSGSKEVETFLTLDLVNEICGLYSICTYPPSMERFWSGIKSKKHLIHISDPFTTIFKK
jgi:hypothetical protein